MDTDHEVTRTRHQMKVPGIGVLIAQKPLVDSLPCTIIRNAPGSLENGCHACYIQSSDPMSMSVHATI